MRKSFYHKGARGKAEKLAADIIKLHKCIHCPETTVDPAHLFQRSSAATCTDLRAIVPLDRLRHGYIDTHPVEKEKLARRVLGDLYDELLIRSNTATKVNWDERVEFLEDVYDRIKEGELTLEEARLYES